MNLIIDASVAGKWFFDEPLKDAADRLIHPQNRFVAPDLLASEFINIVQKNTRSKNITSEFGLTVLRRFQALPIHYIPALELLETAYRISIDLEHPAYDCVYLAIPEKQGGLMITADMRFYRKVRNSSYASLIAWVEDPIQFI